jgi:hypothetical protein
MTTTSTDRKTEEARAMLRMIGVVLVVFAVFVFVFLMAALTLDLADDPDELQYHPPDEPSLSLCDISPRGGDKDGGDDDDQR